MSFEEERLKETEKTFYYFITFIIIYYLLSPQKISLSAISEDQNKSKLHFEGEF